MSFGKLPDGTPVEIYSLSNGGITAKITNSGGIVTELHVPDKAGKTADVVLGFDTLEGYLAVAPELYFRQGDPNDYSDIPTLFSNLVNKVPDAQVLADLDHVASWAARNGGDAHRLMVTGFCWGGRISWLYAAHNPQLKAAVAWYGKLVGEKTLNSPKHPVDIATELNAPVLGLYGGQDTGISLDSVETMRHALRAANANAEIVVYPDAGHAFNADYRPSYHAESAKDGWQRMLAWFSQYGGKK